jgi:hypothetical protein
MFKKPILLTIVVGVIVVAAAVTPSFIRARSSRAANPCVNSLRYIDGATQQWAIENHKTTNDVPTWEDLAPYFQDGKKPTCPNSGTYALGGLDKPPRCSYPGHTLR